MGAGCTLTALGPHWLGRTQWAPGNQEQEDVRQKLTRGLHLLLFNYLQTISKLAYVFGEVSCAFCLCPELLLGMSRPMH